jgi:hypothetical protein
MATTPQSGESFREWRGHDRLRLRVGVRGHGDEIVDTLSRETGYRFGYDVTDVPSPASRSTARRADSTCGCKYGSASDQSSRK